MKKVLLVPVLALLVLSSICLVSAKTLVSGKIYNADFSDTISGADVTITCTDEDDTVIQNFVSSEDGAYAVAFDEFDCNSGDELTVSAMKGDLTGYSSGTIHENMVMEFDIAVVNVPLVPEFGLTIGLLTVLGAVTIFFLVRRD